MRVGSVERPGGGVVTICPSSALSRAPFSTSLFKGSCTSPLGILMTDLAPTQASPIRQLVSRLLITSSRCSSRYPDAEYFIPRLIALRCSDAAHLILVVITAR